MNEYYAYVDAFERGEDGGAVKTGGDGSDALFEHIMLLFAHERWDGSRERKDAFLPPRRRRNSRRHRPFVPDFATYKLADDGMRVGVRLTDPEGFLVERAEVLATLISKMLPSPRTRTHE